MSRYKEYGPIVKETIAGVTFVRIYDPDDVRTVFLNEDKQPNVSPLLVTTKLYRQQRGLSPGIGNTWGFIYIEYIFSDIHTITQRTCTSFTIYTKPFFMNDR